MLSLYEFLGRAAGPKLGKVINHIAREEEVMIGKREENIVNSLYNKPINTYPPSFLASVLTDQGKIKTYYKQKYNLEAELCQQ